MSGIVVLVLRILLTAALYAFLGWALITLWRELRSQSQILALQRVPSLYLTAVEPEESLPSRFDRADILIGRDPSCHFTLSNETVSARHAHIYYRHNQWWVEDLASTNGTFLNDERVTTVTVVATGDEIRCGQAIIRVEISSKA